MAKLNDLIQRYLADNGLTARAFAERVDMSYPTLLSLINKGHVPRKVEHREAIRAALGLDPAAWAGALASSSRDGVQLPSEGPLNLQQMIVKALYANGFSEQTFARSSGIPYPTLLGVTRKGALPRTDTIERMAEGLNLDPDELNRAVERSRQLRREDAPEVTMAADSGGESSPVQRLSALLKRRGLSLAAFAREHEIPYLALMRVVTTGSHPHRDEVLEQLAKALAMTDTQPSDSDTERAGADAPVTPLQAALRKLIDDRHLTMKAFAELADLSVLTATRLVKQGTLPSRAATHQKLRTLLNLSESAYTDLLARSAGPAGTPVASEEGDDFQHRETDEIVPQGDNASALYRRSDLARDAGKDPKAQVVDIIGRLNPRQLQALHQFLVTML